MAMAAGAVLVRVIVIFPGPGCAPSMAMPLCGFWMVASTMLESVVPGTVTVTVLAPLRTVATPLVLKLARPETCSAMPLALVASTPVPSAELP
jgi:hypothetical protein